MRLIFIAIIALQLSGCIGLSGAEPPADRRIWSVAEPRPIGEGDLIAALRGADVVILGEVHDNPAHHLAQAWIVGALAPAGLAFEMIPEASEEGIAVFLEEGGAPGEIGPAIGWSRLGWPDWAIYRPIFEAHSPDVYTGGGVPRREIRAAIADGAASVARHRAFLPGLRSALPGETQAAMEAEMVDAHCGHLPASAAPGMVQAQRLRDASFAAAAIRARQQADGQAVLITGNGHARLDVGVAYYLAAAYPDISVLSVGVLELAPDTAPDPAEVAALPYDFVWFTVPHDREDPCAAFRK